MTITFFVAQVGLDKKFFAYVYLTMNVKRIKNLPKNAIPFKNANNNQTNDLNSTWRKIKLQSCCL